MDENFLKAFRVFGVMDFEKATGNNYKATCPFSGKPGKFYVNDETGMWDSKVTGEKGNIYTFMKMMVEKCEKETRPQDLAPVTDHKGIPIATVVGKLFYNKLSKSIIMPTKNADGTITNVSHWRVGSRSWLRTSGCSVGMAGLDDLIASDNHVPVYITEGEWDMFSVRWLLNINNVHGVVVSLPGAHVFKTEWSVHFEGRVVHCLYDNDKAGHNGETKAANLLRPIAKSIDFFKWNEHYHPDKYDIKDFIVDATGGMDGSASFAKCWESFNANFEKYTHLERENPTELMALGMEEEEEELGPVPSQEEIEDVFQKWLKMNETTQLDFVFGTYFANKIPGDPIWSFLVAPPGGSKTAVLITLAMHKNIEMVSTLTAASLVSGMQHAGGNDPSLIPKLDGRCLVVKDFTTVLSAKDFERDAIFGILRDAFDGSITKPFGNGVVRTYESKFGIIGGVTPAIDSYGSLSSSLGERFLKLRLDKTLSMEEEILRARRAMTNSGQEKEMNEELQAISKRMLAKPMPERLPDVIGDHIFDEVAYCARFTAKLRGAIDRDKYTSELNMLPTQEVATRLTKQYFKLAQGLAIYHDHDNVNEHQMKIVRRVAKDTIPEMMNLVMENCYELSKASSSGWFTKKALLDRLKVYMCNQTSTSRLEDLVVLKILKTAKDKNSKPPQPIYTITDDMKTTIAKSKIYN